MAEGQKEGVKCNVISCLERVLGADQQARKMAEEELKTLEVTEGSKVQIYNYLMYYVFLCNSDYGVVLAEVTASAESPVQYRQVPSTSSSQAYCNSLSDSVGIHSLEAMHYQSLEHIERKI